MSNVHGYARVSTRDQDPAMQLAARRRAGVDELHEETASGVKARPVLAALLARLTEGDTLTIWKLDRLGRTAHEVLLTLDNLRSRGIACRSLTEGLDTSTPTGRAFAGILAVLAQLERETLLERVAAGIAISRAEGRHGRPRSYEVSQVRHARDLVAGGTSLRQAARLTGIPRSTLAEALARLPPPTI
jgi:DNA invertase Pin-like site-specific DNA recombinase